jgi:hypothetical protein
MLSTVVLPQPEWPIVPLVPDEVADAGAAHEHFGRHDHEPGNADRNPHAGENRWRSGRQDHGERAPQRTDLKRARHVDPLLAHGSDTEGGIEQHRPDRADEDHEDRRQAGVLDGVERERHPGERRNGFENLDERIERAADQGRHPDQEAQGNGDDDRKQITEPNACDRITELDAEPLVVRAVIVERLLDVLPQLGADVERPRHRGLALRRGHAHQLGVFGAHGRNRAVAARGKVPDAYESEEQRDRDDRGAERQRRRHAIHDDFLILKLLRYSSGLAGSNVLPITAKDL